MELNRINYDFSGHLWRDNLPNGWHFITLPEALSKFIRKAHGNNESGWGRLKVEAKIGEVSWNTSIWFDSKSGSYLLSIKAGVRKKSQLKAGKLVFVELNIENEC